MIILSGILIALYIILSVVSLIAGFIANGNGTQTDSLTGIFGGIALLFVLVCCIYSFFIKYYTGILITFILYIIFLNIGGALMRAWIRKLHNY